MTPSQNAQNIPIFHRILFNHHLTLSTPLGREPSKLFRARSLAGILADVCPKALQISDAGYATMF